MFEQLLFWILVVLTLLYVILHSMLLKGIKRLFSPQKNESLRSISVIVAARNEEESIHALLQSLIELQYPSNLYEIIIVNDRSTDGTGSIIENFAQRHSNIRHITIQSNTTDMPHKKNALRTAIGQAQYDILAFTDADCIVLPTWLKEISQHFTDDVGVVAGYSPYRRNTSIEYLRYEEFKKTLLAASTAGLRYAFLCTGRNFAYRKMVFEQVGGFEKIKHSISGDDDLFLQLIQRETDWNIRYMVTPESFVHTLPPRSLSQFLHQRTRHISASRYYSTHAQLYYILVHLFHVAALIGFFVFPLHALIAAMLKFNMDGMISAQGAKAFREEFTVRQFFLYETLLVVYSFVIGPLGYLKNFQWKEAAP